MKDYLKPLANELKTILGNNRYFDLDDCSQSFVVFPTNHIELVNDFMSIEIATCIYGNITKHKTIFNNITELYDLLNGLAQNLSEYVGLTSIDSCTIRLLIGGLDSDLKDFDFNSYADLISFVKDYKY